MDVFGVAGVKSGKLDQVWHHFLLLFVVVALYICERLEPVLIGKMILQQK